MFIFTASLHVYNFDPLAFPPESPGSLPEMAGPIYHSITYDTSIRQFISHIVSHTDLSLRLGLCNHTIQTTHHFHFTSNWNSKTVNRQQHNVPTATQETKSMEYKTTGIHTINEKHKTCTKPDLFHFNLQV